MIVLCGAGAAIAAFLVFDKAVISASVVLGAYLVVRGVACYAGHYYNEVTMAQMAKDGLLEDIDPWYWAYVGGFFLLCLIGFYLQCKELKKEKRKQAARDAHPYYGAAKRSP